MNAGSLAAALSTGVGVALLLRLLMIARGREPGRLPRSMQWLALLGQCSLPDPRYWRRSADSSRTWAVLEREVRLAGLASGLDVGSLVALLVGSTLAVALLGVCMLLVLPSSSGIQRLVVIATMASLLAPACVMRWLRGQRVQRERSLLRDLPVGLDLLALLVESGCALPAALQEAARYLSGGALAGLFGELSRQFALGRSRRDVLRQHFEAEQGSSLASTLAALLQAESTGSSLAPVLRAQASQRTEERFAAAERAALQAPVRMLLPLVTCIFPCTFIVIAFPLLTRFSLMGPS